MLSNKKWKLLIEDIKYFHEILLKEYSPSYIYKNIGAPLIYATYLSIKSN